MSQIVNSAAQATRTNGKHMDADGQARMVFDRMAGDLSGMLKRQDADVLFYKNSGNDVMYFYSEGPAYFTNSVLASNKNTVALVGYRINGNNPLYPRTPVLERLGKGLLWNDPASTNTPVYLTTPAGSAIPTNSSTLSGNWSSALGTMAGGYTNGSDSSFQVLGELAYRMEIQFLLTDGTISNQPILTNQPANWPAGPRFYIATSSDPRPASGTYTTGSRWFNTSTQRGYLCTSPSSTAAVWTPIGMHDVSAIVVTLAILDGGSRKIIPSSATISGSPLVDSVDGSYIGSSWTQAITNSTFATQTGIPKASASQVRIFQRCFPIQ